MTLGSYINSQNVKANPENDLLFAHEYGHTIQSEKLGLLYLPLVAVPSILGQGAAEVSWLNHNHDGEWYETWANRLAIRKGSR
jgi:hypothetical protein